MSIGGLSASNIDPRLWAYLRILYAKSESDLTKHGYTPFTLQSAGSVLSADIEAQVIKTMVGIVGVLIHISSADMKVGATATLSFLIPSLYFPSFCHSACKHTQSIRASFLMYHR